MKKFLIILMLFAVNAKAGTLVYNDSGNIGEFRATNTGIVDGTATIVFSVPNLSSQMNTVNGSFIAPEAISVPGPITLLVTSTGVNTYSLGLDPPEYQKVIGDTPGAQAILNFNLQTGVTPLANFFNASGIVTGLEANLNPNYDFSLFSAGTGTINFTFTATAFNGATDFASFFATSGAVAVGNGSFSQAIPEPKSVILFGLGIMLLPLFKYISG